MTERLISIDPDQRDELLGIVDTRFHEWHRNEWATVYPDFGVFHDQVAEASFLACLELALQTVDDTGQVSSSRLEELLKEKLGIYYRQEKFENLLHFLQAGDWESL